jgi:signal transduction histidine kinase
MYIQYNILVEELGYMIKQQNAYEGKRKEFLTILSHELKTPIATINAYIEGLISGVAKDEASREKYQQIIYQKMQQLTTQIEELFKYAQEESGRFKYNFEECYADELFIGIFDRLASQNKFPVKVKQLIPKCIINVDETRIEQVIMNLYNNALKHSKKADCIELTGYRQDNEIIIEVSDNGEGIDPKDMPYIFDYYYQGKSSKNEDYEGIGLGLAICKDIVSKHQGTIKVKSVLGDGTTFTIILPIV